MNRSALAVLGAALLVSTSAGCAKQARTFTELQPKVRTGAQAAMAAVGAGIGLGIDALHHKRVYGKSPAGTASHAFVPLFGPRHVAW